MTHIRQAIRSGHWPSLVGAWLHFEFSFVVWLLVGALGVLIASEFGLTATQKGFLVAVPLLSGAVLRVAVGASSDCFGPKRTGLAILVFELAALLWGWLGASTYLEVLAGGVLLGVAGASFAVALPLASRAYPPAHQGLVMGVAASGNSGTVLAAFFAPRLAEVVGWHGVFGLITFPVLLTLALYGWLVRNDAETVTPGAPQAWGPLLAEALRRPSMYWLCFMYAITFGGFVGLASFLPIFFHDQYGLALVTAGSMTAACGLAGSVTRPVGGYLADRIGGLRVLAGLFPAIGVLVVGVSLLPPLALAAPLMILAVATMGFGNGVVFQVVSHRFKHQIGIASGLIGAAGGLGGFFLPSALGVLKDAVGTYQAGFLLFAAFCRAAWFSVLLASDRRRFPANGQGGWLSGQ
ncbi:MAG: MFS transporter [Nitrospirales bacterium]